MTMSNRIAVMRFGKVEQIGAPEDTYENPSTEFVAGFLGASNLLDGEVTGRDGALAIISLTDGGTVTVPTARVNGQGPSVKVGVRPEKIRLQSEGAEPPAGWNSVAGTLSDATFVGVSHQFTVEGPGTRPLSVYAQNLGTESLPAPGQRVRLVWKPEHTFVVRPSVPLAVEEEER